MQDTIERELDIAADIDRVWTLITEAEHLGTWFGDRGADIDLRPGGTMQVRWDGHDLDGQVVTVDPTSRFAFRWQQIDVAPGTTLGDGNSTLVEFTLEPRGTGTHLRVVESGFASLDLPTDDRRGLLEGHTKGWMQETGELADHARTQGAAV